LDLESSDFDTSIQAIEGSTGELIGADDDGGPGNNSRLFFSAKAGTTYLVRATSETPNQSGDYSLSLASEVAPNQHNIADVTTATLDNTLQLTVTFVEAIAPPSTESANAIFGEIEFDLDQMPDTPAGGDPDELLGVEAFIDLSSEEDFPGTVEIVDNQTNATLGFAPISFTENSFTLDIALSDLLGDDGSLNYRISIANLFQTTDVFPNEGVGQIPQDD
ncbi:MAG: hypothetical protein AAF704_18600, partial [Cyanobacteria bacterium P01_D01_bin.123]